MKDTIEQVKLRLITAQADLMELKVAEQIAQKGEIIGMVVKTEGGEIRSFRITDPPIKNEPKVEKFLDVEPINTPEHRMEIRLMGDPNRWTIKTTEDGELRESYRPLTKKEILKVVAAALVEEE